MKKIFCVGDSWSHGYGVDQSKTWPAILNNYECFDVVNIGQSGSSNFAIADNVTKILKLDTTIDTIIVGWSGVTRYRHKGNDIDFSYAKNIELRDNFFKKKKLIDIENDFLGLNQQINELCKEQNVNLVKFSVFGDFKYLWDDFYTEDSFLEYL